ncbi:TRAP transporter small permease subunit [uncultured Thiothrix sp.]|uniref:TRAP transporter small permease subunit n=1 Tax=uncultured Thiothrix sp. TaxID=223185 RepID=UPI0026295F4D|nr:TRAP transporter small permease subunit [uncultured Thiothrix sp.]HMT94336.1 TRAP transporter small permease subunit [Thiolinea sp.]
MKGLLSLSSAIDTLNYWIGRAVMWLVLLMVLISAGNAIIRKLFNTSSNAYLEAQWYLFAAVFLLGASYTMLQQGHVKIDVIISRFSRPTQVKIEIFGIIFFLFPLVYFVITEIFPILVQAYKTGEMSENAGGLIRWPVYALVPTGFFLLGLQGISELIKRIGFLKGLCPDPGDVKEVSAEEALAEHIQQQQLAQGQK